MLRLALNLNPSPSPNPNQAFLALNRSFPHAGNRLINRAQMATGPEAFSRCLNAYLPVEADAVVIAFADMCKLRGGSPTLPLAASYGLAMEGIVRTLLARPDPPAVLLLNHFSYRDWGCTSECLFVESCDAGLGEIARSYHVGTGAHGGGPDVNQLYPYP